MRLNKKFFVSAVCVLMGATPASAQVNQVSKEDKYVHSPEVSCTLEALPDSKAEHGTELGSFDCRGYGRVTGLSESGIYTLKAGYLCDVYGWPVWQDSLRAACTLESRKAAHVIK